MRKKSETRNILLYSFLSRSLIVFFFSNEHSRWLFSLPVLLLYKYFQQNQIWADFPVEFMKLNKIQQRWKFSLNRHSKSIQPDGSEGMKNALIFLKLLYFLHQFVIIFSTFLYLYICICYKKEYMYHLWKEEKERENNVKIKAQCLL